MTTVITGTTSDLKQTSYISAKKIGYYGSFIAIPTLVLFVGINFWFSNKAEQAGDWVAHTHQVTAALSQIQLALKSAETGQRGFLLTEDTRYLEPYTQSIERLDELLTTVRLLTLDNPSQQNRLKKITPLIDKKLSELEQTIFLMTTQSREAAIGIVISGEGKKLMEQLSASISEMRNEEYSLLIDRRQTLNTSKILVIWTQLIGFILLILIGIITFFKVRKLLFWQKKAEKELLIANEELAFQNQEKDKRANELTLAASVFTHALEGIMITDATTTIIDVNTTFTEITGYSREEVIGQSSRFLQAGSHPPTFFATIWQVINTTGQWVGEILSRRKNGEEYVSSITISAVKDTVGKISHYVSLFRDITQQREHQCQLEQMAHYDALTKLPNRALFTDRLNQAMLQCQRHHNSLAVTFMDLDGFKYINDTYGHVVGDELLIVMAERLSGALREVDTLARISGDEFVVVLTDLVKPDDYKSSIERLLLAASQPIILGDLVLKVSVSIGVTLYPQDTADSDILIRHADQAMYVAKQAGKNRYHLFDSAHDDAVNIRQESLTNISAALHNHEFVLYYQPKVNMASGDVIGVEALIRWQHPVRGLVPPLDFLPIIENHAISLDIGEWVIDTALSQISQWQSLGVTLPISVNISAYQLQQTDFVERLAALLAAHPDVSPHYLELEVLETSALSDINYIITTMQACIDLGVQFALDDFGTGYSSLTYLRRLPASLIKIDQSFIRYMLSNADDLAIVLGVVSLAKAFRLEVIAEGVETIEHGTVLLQLGCELAQGYGIARPMPAHNIPLWLESWKPDKAWLA
jgi:diguanylate cyclase (GGDEF)-like protein/PAS domain S-box-containing protein